MEALLIFGYDQLGVEKIAALVILVFIWIVKVVKNRSDGSREAKYARVGEMIAELEKEDQKDHAFIVEQVFQNRFGILVDYPIIKYFLRSNTPSKDLYKYIQGGKYIEFSENYRQLYLKGRLSPLKLRVRSWIHFISYVAAAFLGLSLVAAVPHAEFEKLANLVVFVLFIVTCIMWAFLSLEEGSKPSAAIHLAEKYRNRVN